MASGYHVKMAAQRKALQKRLLDAWAEVNETDLPQAFDFSLGADIWSWPRETERQNGEVVGRIRNAIDEGDLADSYRRQRLGRRRFIHRWNVPYAALVHNGATLSNGTVLPPRPWTDEGVAFIPQFLAQRFRDLG